MKEAEKEILKLIKKGDQKAFEYFYKAYYQTLVNFSVLYTKDKFVSEEIVNDFFTSLWERRKIISIHSNPASYLYQSIKNRSLNYLKAKKKQAIETLKEEFSAEAACTPEKYLNIKEEQAETERLLQLIPPKSRQIFIMCKFDKLKYKEIAQILDISINTVENHMVKAMRILKNYYSKQ